MIRRGGEAGPVEWCTPPRGKATAELVAEQETAVAVVKATAGPVDAVDSLGKTIADVVEMVIVGHVAGKEIVGRFAGKATVGRVAGKATVGRVAGEAVAEPAGKAVFEQVDTETVASAAGYHQSRATVTAAAAVEPGVGVTESHQRPQSRQPPEGSASPVGAPKKAGWRCPSHCTKVPDSPAESDQRPLVNLDCVCSAEDEPQGY